MHVGSNHSSALALPAPPRPGSQHRALATYIRRLYYPYLLHEPEVQALAGSALAAGALRLFPCGSSFVRAACCIARLSPGMLLPASCSARTSPGADGVDWLGKALDVHQCCAANPALNPPQPLPPQCGPSTTPRWLPHPLLASVLGVHLCCAACTTCPLR